jgi:hypothetical protein
MRERGRRLPSDTPAGEPGAARGICLYRACMRRAQILTAIIVMMSIPACGPGGPEPAAAPPATSRASLAPADAPASSTTGAVTACKLAAEAPRTGETVDIDEQAVRATIDNAGKSGVESIEQAGTQLQARYSAWLRADIGDESAKALDDLLDAVGRINSACIDVGVTAS